VISKKPKLWMCTNCDRAVVVALESISEISVTKRIIKNALSEMNAVLRRRGNGINMNRSLSARLLDKEGNT